MSAFLLAEGEAIPYIPVADVAKGTVVKKGELVGVVNLDTVAGKVGSIITHGLFGIPREIGSVFAIGDRVYINLTTQEATTNTAQTFAGFYVKDNDKLPTDYINFLLVQTTPSVGGGGTWGTITGTLSAQADLQTALNLKINSSEKGSANGVAPLGAGGKIASTYLPPIAITDTFVVASQVAMLALTAETGDIAVRTDLSKTFILKGTDPTVLGDWQELQTPTDAVLSVNGQTGTVSLTQDNIGDGTTYKQYSATEKTKLSGIATGATANSSDATLLARANHTGTQLAATISDFSTAVAASINAELARLVGATTRLATAGNTFNPQTSRNNIFTMDGNLASLQPTANGVYHGQPLIISFRQDATGGRTASYGTNIEFTTDVGTPVLSGGANVVDDFFCTWNSITSKWRAQSFNRGA